MDSSAIAFEIAARAAFKADWFDFDVFLCFLLCFFVGVFVGFERFVPLFGGLIVVS